MEVSTTVLFFVSSGSKLRRLKGSRSTVSGRQWETGGRLMKFYHALVVIPLLASVVTACGSAPSASPDSSGASGAATKQPVSPKPLPPLPSDSASPISVVSVDASEVASLIKAEVQNATDVVTFTSENDLNGLIGAENGYVSAASIRDNRIQIKKFKEKDLGVAIGATVEVWPTAEDARARVDRINRDAPLTDEVSVEYQIISGQVLLRVSQVIDPNGFAAYSSAFRKQFPDAEVVSVNGMGNPDISPKGDSFTIDCIKAISASDETDAGESFTSLTDFYKVFNDVIEQDLLCGVTLDYPDAFVPTAKQLRAIRRYSAYWDFGSYSDNSPAGIYSTMLEWCVDPSQTDGLMDRDMAMVAYGLCPDSPGAASAKAIADKGVVPFDGDWKVGEEIREGTWRSEAPASDCYWERTTSGGSTIANDFVTFAKSGVTVTIKSSDGSFSTQGCGSWRRID